MISTDHDYNALKLLFSNIEDPRDEPYILYPVSEIIFLTIAAVLCGIENWRGISIFGEKRLDWLRKFFPFKDGVPSRFTIARLFAVVKPAYFESMIGQVASLLKKDLPSNLVAIDGKTLRAASNIRHSPLHLINAMSIGDGIALSQVSCAAKSNEIAAIPYILNTLQLEGTTITIDAIGCQKSIVQKIRKGGGDFIIAVKENQLGLYNAISSYFESTGLTIDNQTYFHETIEKAHGRFERRAYQVAYPPREPIFSQWKGIHSIILVISEVTKNGKTTSAVRYFISSLDPNPQKAAFAIRGHWGIENQLHWTLDVVFNEDWDIKRKDHAPRNFAAIRKVVINLIRSFLGTTTGVKNARMVAALCPDHMMNILKSAFL